MKLKRSFRVDFKGESGKKNRVVKYFENTLFTEKFIKKAERIKLMIKSF